MPRYSVVARHFDRTVYREVQADSADRVVQQLEGEGLQDIRIEVSNATTNHVVDEPLQNKVTRVLNAETRAELMVVREPGRVFMLQLSIALRTLWWVEAASVVLFLVRQGLGTPLGWIDIGLGLAFVLPVLVAAWATFAGPQRHYRRYLECMNAAQWSQAMQSMAPLKKYLSDPVHASCEARALAGAGSLSRALAHLQPHKEELGPFAFHAQRSLVFGEAGDFEAQREAMELAHTHAADPGELEVDLAMWWLLHREDLDQAGAYLRQARAQTLSEMAKERLAVAEATRQLLRGDAIGASKVLEDALGQATQDVAHRPELVGWRAILALLLARACLMRGQTQEALPLLELAVPYLQLHHGEPLIARVRAFAVGALVAPMRSAS